MGSDARKGVGVEQELRRDLLAVGPPVAKGSINGEPSHDGNDMVSEF